jgi:probable F420-dependent oxidoreductase
MKFGIAFANTMGFAEAEGAAVLARGAEAAGFDSVWTVEHVIVPKDYESTYPYDPSGKMPGGPEASIPDPLIWLTWVAANSTTLRLATGILILPERNPLVLAKAVATLDNLSGGRVDLGIGVGWLEEEFDALGIPWAKRGARTDEYIQAMRSLWSSDLAEYSGEFVSFKDIASKPAPANGTVPIHIGGHSAASARRAGRIGDGFFPAGGDTKELIDIVRQTAADNDRDPAAIEITTFSFDLFGDDPLAAVEEMRDMGVHRLMVPAYMVANDPENDLASWGERIISQVSE